MWQIHVKNYVYPLKNPSSPKNVQKLQKHSLNSVLKWRKKSSRSEGRGERFPSGWRFGTFFIFPYIGNNNPNWLSYFSEGLKPPTSPASVEASKPLRWHLSTLRPCGGEQESVGASGPNLSIGFAACKYIYICLYIYICIYDIYICIIYTVSYH